MVLFMQHVYYRGRSAFYEGFCAKHNSYDLRSNNGKTNRKGHEGHEGKRFSERFCVSPDSNSLWLLHAIVHFDAQSHGMPCLSHPLRMYVEYPSPS